MASTLENTGGKLPETSPFDLRDSLIFSGRDIWSPPIQDVVKGDLWITYPFKESYSGLGETSRDPELAKEIKTQLECHLNSIVDEAASSGIDKASTRWTVQELLVNATQYGAISPNNDAAGLVRLEWYIDQAQAVPTIAIAVTNPCQDLFDPSRFARMEIDDFYSMEPTGNNAHLGTVAILSFLKEGTKLSYLWEMKNSERIRLTMEPIANDDPARPADFNGLMKPTRIEVSKFDVANNSVPYSFKQFQEDIENNNKTESVTISCVLGCSGHPQQ